MDKPAQSPALYDEMYAHGGYQGVYDLPYRHSAYYPLLKEVLKRASDRRVRSILEVGCGSGAFAHLLMDRSTLGYRGFDFSRVAVQRAAARTGARDAFFIGDATATASYEGQDYDCVVCTEVLEHIEHDLQAIASWKGGSYCICSVPNFDCETHVRFFSSEDEVRERYGGLIAIESIARIKKPVLSDISFSSVLRALRWNRYRPDRLAEILGMVPFDRIGGWFLFCGTRRPEHATC
jgi:SAM-dependent methyltransferase